MKHSLFSSLIFLFCTVSAQLFAQSSDCSPTPTSLPVNSSCVTQSFANNDNGTTQTVNASCATGTAYEDVWYSVTGTGNPITITVSGSNTASTLAAFSGCGTGELACTNIASGATGSIVFPSTVGTTYFIQIQRRSGTNNGNQSGNVCAVSAPPSTGGDEPCVATPVPVNPTNICTSTVTGTIAGATASAVANGCGGTADDDVWFSFVATNTTHLINLNNITGGTTDLYHSVYAGSCGSPGAALICSDPNSSTITGLTPGNTYYLRVYSWTSTPGQTSVFDVCIGTPPPPPANDDCAGAIPVPVNPTNICSTTVTGTIASATPSSPATGCSGTADDDVWFSFVATSTSHLINLINITGGTTDLYHSVYAGSCGSPGTPLVCSDPNNSTVTGLTPGNTYYVRVYSWTSTTGQTSVFDICIGTPPPPPSNDDCGGAIPVPVNPTNICSSMVTGTIYSATPSSPATGCGGTADDDVWFSFVATNPTQLISLNNISGGTTDLYHSVYAGSCGSPGTPLVCSDPNNSVVNGLIPGNTYYVRVYSWTSLTGQTSVFDICIGTPPPPPANDDCAGAIPVPVSSSTCSYTTGTIASATPSSPATGCSGTADDDVWYSFVATSPAVNISLTNITGGTTDLYHSVYAGSCGAPGTPLVCSDPNTSTVTGLTPGNTYFVRIYSWTSTAGQTSVFDLCILEAGACGTPNNQDYCVAPAVLTPGTSFSSNTSGTYTADIPANLNSVFCGSIENNSWYEFVATSTSASFPITSVSGCTYGIQAQIYAVSEDVNGCCTNFTSVSNCYNPANLSLGTVTATGLTVGNTYVLMIDGNGGAICDFTISGWNGTGILPVELISFTGLAMPDYNALNWSTASENNNDHFNVLRSYDGNNFDKIGELMGAGSALTTHQYTFHDEELRSGEAYYQLEQVDYNGSSTKSEVIVVNRHLIQEAMITVYPNPAENNIDIEILHELEGGVIQLVDSRGGVIMEKQIDINSGTHVQLDLQSVNSGLYFVRLIESDGTLTTQKITKK